MRVRSFTGGDFLENAYIVTCEATGHVVVVDPGAAAPEIVDALADDAASVAAILLTHAHLDHVEGLEAIRAITDAPTHLHAADRPMFDNMPAQAAMFGLSSPSLDPPERELEDGQTLHFGSCVFQVIHTPGHSPGHVILHAEAQGLALVGDLVFAGSVGRTDLPGGDYQALFHSIRQHVLTMPDDTQLYTGHGPPTTVGRERTTNPFLIPHFGGELA
jgi:glyoxylase-like metal-dependent hydrolase (beta-lactamase superfamily II)